MNQALTTRMSSKGQVVIPEALRNSMHLDAGAEFVVMGEGDVVILKSITPPSLKDLQPILKKARAYAAKAGIRPKDIARLIAEVRANK